MKRALPLPIKSVIRFYVEKQWSLEKIAGCFNCSEPTIRQRLVAAGIEIRKCNDTKRGAPSPLRHSIDDKAAVDCYLASENTSINDVARSFGCHPAAVKRALIKYNVPIRSLSQVIGGKRNGAANPNWRDDLTPEERLSRRDMAAQAKWRTQVYQRDRFACVKCGDATGKNLNAHHVESHDRNRELRWKVENGATLCEICHLTFHKRFGFGRNTAAQFAQFLASLAMAA